MIPFAFEDGFGYERYVDWALDVPMYFIKRDSTYHDVAGSSFRDLPRRPASGAARRDRDRSDWANHVSTLFPEVRLKRYLEMRGADVGPPERIVALSAFWVGLLYDAAALDQAWQLVKGWSAEEREALRADVPKRRARRRRRRPRLREVARTLRIAHAGLKAPRAARRDGRRRDPPSRPPRRDRRRPHAGRAPAGTL